MVTKKPKGLGRGLEALLGPKVDDAAIVAANAQQGEPSTLPLAEMVPGMYQPRTRMDEGALYELAESIKAQGIMQPILVRKLESGANAGKYEIIAGERRSRAAKLAGLKEVPVLVRNVPNEAAAAMALIENIQREDLNPLEEAQGLNRLIREFGLTHEQAAQVLGRSRSATTNLLRLLGLPKPVQDMVFRNELDMGHARALLALPASEQAGVKWAELVGVSGLLAQPGYDKFIQEAKALGVNVIHNGSNDDAMIKMRKESVAQGFGSQIKLWSCTLAC